MTKRKALRQSAFEEEPTIEPENSRTYMAAERAWTNWVAAVEEGEGDVTATSQQLERALQALHRYVHAWGLALVRAVHPDWYGEPGDNGPLPEYGEAVSVALIEHLHTKVADQCHQWWRWKERIEADPDSSDTSWLIRYLVRRTWSREGKRYLEAWRGGWLGDDPHLRHGRRTTPWTRALHPGTHRR